MAQRIQKISESQQSLLASSLDKIKSEVSSELSAQFSGITAAVEVVRLEGERIARDHDGLRLCIGVITKELDMRAGNQDLQRLNRELILAQNEIENFKKVFQTYDSKYEELRGTLLAKLA